MNSQILFAELKRSQRLAEPPHVSIHSYTSGRCSELGCDVLTRGGFYTYSWIQSLVNYAA